MRCNRRVESMAAAQKLNVEPSRAGQAPRRRPPRYWKWRLGGNSRLMLLLERHEDAREKKDRPAKGSPNRAITVPSKDARVLHRLRMRGEHK